MTLRPLHWLSSGYFEKLQGADVHWYPLQVHTLGRSDSPFLRGGREMSPSHRILIRAYIYILWTESAILEFKNAKVLCCIQRTHFVTSIADCKVQGTPIFFPKKKKGKRYWYVRRVLIFDFTIDCWLWNATFRHYNFLSERKEFITTVLVFLSLHKKEYFDKFKRQLKLFSSIHRFLTCVVLKIFASGADCGF